MQPIIMQDWTTIRGAASTTAIMSQADWILTAPFQDISFYLDVREYQNTVQVSYETCFFFVARCANNDNNVFTLDEGGTDEGGNDDGNSLLKGDGPANNCGGIATAHIR